MDHLQDLCTLAHAAHREALMNGREHQAIRLKRIVRALERELDDTAHHPNCECGRCYSNMGDPA